MRSRAPARRRPRTTAFDRRGLSPLLSPGDAVALTGELGAGKTTFAQGLARGLGFEGHVVSPTFTLVREYRPARLPVVHADVYRLERVQDVLDLGLEQSRRGRRPARRVGRRRRGAAAGRPPGGRARDRRSGRGADDRGTDRGPVVAPAMGAARTAARAVEERPGGGRGLVIVLGIDTSTEQTSVALGTEREIVGTARFAGVRRHDDVVPAIERLLEWTGIELRARRRRRRRPRARPVHGAPGRGSRPRKALAQVLGVPIVGDLLAGRARVRRPAHEPPDRRRDRRPPRGGLLRLLPAGPGRRDAGRRLPRRPRRTRWPPSSRSSADEMLLVGNGAILYRQELEEVDARVELRPGRVRPTRGPRRSWSWRPRGSSANRPTARTTWYRST